MPGGLLVDKEGEAFKKEPSVILQEKARPIFTTFTIISGFKKSLFVNGNKNTLFLFSQVRHHRYHTSCHQLICSCPPPKLLSQ